MCPETRHGKGFAPNAIKRMPKRFVWLMKDCYFCVPLATKGNGKFIER